MSKNGGGFAKIARGLSDLFDFLSELEETELPSRGRHEKDGMVIEFSFGKRALGEAAAATEPAKPRRAARSSLREVFEPVTDMFDEPTEIVLLFELPGVEERNIRCLLDGDILLLEAATGERLYRKEMLIEAKLAPTPPRRHLHNGVLEVRLRKGT
jgi:HSP20 family protein